MIAIFEQNISIFSAFYLKTGDFRFFDIVRHEQ